MAPPASGGGGIAAASAAADAAPRRASAGPDAPPDAAEPTVGAAAPAGFGSSLYAGLSGAKRALARALLGFALVVPAESRAAVSAAELDASMARLRMGGEAANEGPLDFDYEFDAPEDDDEEDEEGSEEEEAGEEEWEAEGCGAPAAARGASASSSSSPDARLKRFATLKQIQCDTCWSKLAASAEPLNLSSGGGAAAAPEGTAAAAAAALTAAAPAGDAPASEQQQQQQDKDKVKPQEQPQQPPPQRPLSGPPSQCSRISSSAGLPPGALNLSRLRGGPQTAWEPPVFGADIRKKEYTTVASDGWTLHIVHTTDAGAPPELRRHHPVLLCPGLASSGVGTFDLAPEVSIADYLAAAGWDVWCVCLRGNGASDKSSKIDVSSWTIDDHLFQDVPAVLSFVLGKTGATQVHWIGHSMGGMLGAGLLSQGVDGTRYAAALRSLVLYGSGCFGDGSWHSLLKRIVIPITRMGFPADLACQGLSLLTDKPAALSLFESLFYWFPNVAPHIRKRLLQCCFNFIPTTLTGQFLDTHDGPEGLMNVARTFRYADPDVLADTLVPVLAVNGDWDLFCPAAGGKKTADLFGGPKKALTIGTKQGYKSHYGHFDVVVGKHAREEVWPHLTEHLELYD